MLICSKCGEVYRPQKDGFKDGVQVLRCNACRTRKLPVDDGLEVVLAIGDIHAPFTIKGYLEFCIDVYVGMGCTKVVFMGDIVDNHASSYHESDPDGMSAGDELDYAKIEVSKWYKAFPYAVVLESNHDSIIKRKTKTSGLSSEWIRPFNEVFNTPNWEFKDYVIINDVLYQHGVSKTASSVLSDEAMSIVQGHRHSESYVKYKANLLKDLFACQVGCGCDRLSYAMSYAKYEKKPMISCAVIDSGKYCTVIPMKLK